MIREKRFKAFVKTLPAPFFSLLALKMDVVEPRDDFIANRPTQTEF